MTRPVLSGLHNKPFWVTVEKLKGKSHITRDTKLYLQICAYHLWLILGPSVSSYTFLFGWAKSVCSCHFTLTDSVHTHVTPVSWPQRSSSNASSAKYQWRWGWPSEQWTTREHAGWCSHSSCESAPHDTAEDNQHIQVTAVASTPILLT